MSEFENTNLPFLEKDCIETFGEEQGKKVFDKTIGIYIELTRKADYRNNVAIRYHMTVKLFPAMSYYKALQAFGIDDAIEKVRIETQKAALINKQNNAKFARMPFVFTMYRMGVKSTWQRTSRPKAGKRSGCAVTEKKYTSIFIRACITIFALRRVARNYAEYIAKTTTSLFRGLCRRSVLKEWERSAKEQSTAISILSTRKRNPVRIEPYRS